MALNPVAYIEKVAKSFLRYQLTAYPFSDPHLLAQMRELLSLDHTRASPLLRGPYVSLSRPFRAGAPVRQMVDEGLIHPHLTARIPPEITHLYSHQERAIRAVAAGRTTLISTGTGSGKTECFLYPVLSRALAPDGAHCLFAGPVAGSRQGRTVLARLPDQIDPRPASASRSSATAAGRRRTSTAGGTLRSGWSRSIRTSIPS